MITASNLIARAIKYQIPKVGRRFQNIPKILRKKNKNKLHTNDKREYYRTIYLKSDHWKKLRKEKLSLNPICEKCGSKSRVEPHHKEYRSLYNVTVDDLVTLCRRCHELEHPKTHKKKDKYSKRRKRKQEKNDFFKFSLSRLNFQGKWILLYLLIRYFQRKNMHHYHKSNEFACRAN